MEYEIRGLNDDADKRLAERARMQASVDQQGLEKPVFIGELVAHFREHELVDLGDDGKAYSTRNRCNSVLNKWVLPRWQSTKINEVRTIEWRIGCGACSWQGEPKRRLEKRWTLVQSRDTLGVHEPKSDFGPSTRLRRSSERKARTNS